MKTARMADELSARLVAVIATVLLVLGCDPAPNPRDQYGDVTLQLQTPDGAYELGGSITFDRVGSPPFSRTELLDGGEESTSVTLLVGTYDVTSRMAGSCIASMGATLST